MVKFNEKEYADFMQRLDLKRDKIDYSGTFIKNNPDGVAFEWGNGAFMGNGMIGCMVYKDSPD